MRHTRREDPRRESHRARTRKYRVREDSVEVLHQFTELDVATHSRIEHELDAHALHEVAAPAHDFLFELEWRNAEVSKPPISG